MKHTTISSKNLPFVVILLWSLMESSCTEKLIVVSDSCVYHPKTNSVFTFQNDSSLTYYEHLKVPRRTFKEMEKSAN